MRVDLKRIECVRACARVHLILVTMTMTLTFLFASFERKENAFPFLPFFKAKCAFCPFDTKI